MDLKSTFVVEVILQEAVSLIKSKVLRDKIYIGFSCRDDFGQFSQPSLPPIGLTQGKVRGAIMELR